MGRGRDVITSLLFSDFLWSFPLSDYFCRTLQKPPCIRVTILLACVFDCSDRSFYPNIFYYKSTCFNEGWVGLATPPMAVETS